MNGWLKIIALSLFIILLVSVFLSLGAKNWIRGVWESLKVILSIIAFGIVLVSVIGLSIIYLGKDYSTIPLGEMFLLVGLAFYLGGPYLERRYKYILPPRMVEYQDALGIAGQRFKGMGTIFIGIGVLYLIATPLFPHQDPNTIVEWSIPLVLYISAIWLISRNSLSSFRMKRRFANIARADQNTLMTYWPPVVNPLFGPQKTSNWELFRKRLPYQKDLGIRKALVMMLPEQGVKRVVWLVMLCAIVAAFFIPMSRPSHSHNPLSAILIRHKFSIAIFWIAAIVTAFIEERIRQRFVDALLVRIGDIESTEGPIETRPV